MPQILTEAIANEIVEAVARGVPVGTAAQAAGITREAFYRVIERAKTGQAISPETQSWALQLADKLDLARAKWEADRVQAIQSIAVDPSHRDSFKANQFMLTHFPSTRQTYREERRSIVEHQSDPSLQRVHMVVRELPAAGLLALGNELLELESGDGATADVDADDD